MKIYGGSGGIAPPFLTSALDGGERSASLPDHFTPGEVAPGAHWTGDWVCHRAGLDTVEKRKILPLPGIEPQPVARCYTDWAIPALSTFQYAW
jgi:hypothetical protein